MDEGIGLEGGAVCNRDGCKGIMEYIRQGACSCHINPPCSACVEAPLMCPLCGAEVEQELDPAAG